MSHAPRLEILVVDPDEGTTLELKDLLTQEGYQVTSLVDPGEAANFMKAHRHHIVILDVSPDNPAGVGALEALRSVDDDLCVIATTTMPTVEMAVATMKHQAFHYLRKPLDEDELRSVVNEAIRDKGLVVDLETRLNEVVGQRIRERRHGNALTLKQLANRTGLSVSLISQIELGKSAASMSTLHKLASALGVRMTYFFETV